MSGLRPSAFMAASIIGRSKPSQRAEVAVSGRITPTLTPPAGAPLPAEVFPLLPDEVSLLAPHADTARETPTPAARRARVILRIRRPFKPENVAGHNICVAGFWGNPLARSR